MSMTELNKEQKQLEKEIINLVKKFSKNKFKKEKFIKGKTEVKVTGKVINQDEIINMVKSSLDGWLTSGRFNKEFETKLSKKINCKLLMTVNSGSSANLVATSALTSQKLKDRALKKGDEFITVASSFPTTINPAIQYGCIPNFVDIELNTLNIDINLVEQAITKNTKAIIIAHALGNPFDVKSIQDLCKKYNLWLIEDCCDALGAKFNDQHVGTFGDFGTLSFYPAHHITMGEGGAVFTNNITLKRIAESFRDWGRDCYCGPGKSNTCNKRYCWKLGDLPYGYDHKYIYSHIGYNLKITDMQAACGLAQINKLDKFISKRIKNFDYLNNKFRKLEEYFILPKSHPSSKPSWFGYPLTIRETKIFQRVKLLEHLNNKNISTRLLFAGNIIKQPMMKGVKYNLKTSQNNTNKVMNDTFWIGLFPGLEKKHLDYIFYEISEFIQKKS